MITPLQPNNLNYKNTQSFKGFNTSKLAKAFTDSKGNASLTEGLAHALGKFSNTKLADKMVRSMEHLGKHPYARIGDFASLVLTLFNLQDIAKSKKIEKERKPSLMLNTALVTGVSSTAAFLIDAATDPIVDKINLAYKNLIRNSDGTYDLEKVAKYQRSLNKLKSLSIFSLVVRFAVPVLIVPVTGMILERSKKKKEQQKLNAEQAKISNTENVKKQGS